MTLQYLTGNRACPREIPIIAQLIYSSGPREWDYVLGEQALAVITAGWHKETLFGHRYHTLAYYQDQVVGVIAAYSFCQYTRLFIQTTGHLLRHYSPSKAIQCSYRGLRIKHHMPFPARQGWYVAHVAVAAAYRKQGIAKQLLTALRERAKRQLVPQLTLDVRTDNQPAIRLYQQQGYKKIKAYASWPSERNHDCHDSVRMQYSTQL